MPEEFRRYNDRREIIKMDLVAPSDYTDNVILCVPKFAYDVARALLMHYGKFRTSYAVEYQELFYKIPNDAEFDQIEASIDLFLGSRDMSCDIVTALECICDAFQLQVAATNELVAATYTSSVSANYAGSPEQAAGVEGGSIPVGAGAPDAGITDRKCKAAHYIVDNINFMMFGLLTNPPPDWYDIGDTDNYLRQLGDTSSFGNLLTAIYGSYQDLASAIFGGAIDYQSIYDDIVANYDDIICALFNATSATDARADFLAELTIVGDEYSFVADMLYNNILNTLWFAVEDSETQLASWPTTVDCDVACAGCGIEQTDFVFLVGTVNSWVDMGAYVDVQMTGELSSGRYKIVFYRNPCCLSSMQILTHTGTWEVGYEYRDCSGTTVQLLTELQVLRNYRYGFFTETSTPSVATFKIYKAAL